MAPTFYHFTSVTSTNAVAGEMIKNGEIAEKCFLTADYQTDGKGRSENKWHSEPGKNLLLSWVTFPAFLSVSKQFQLSKGVSLAITDLLGSIGLTAAIKWPNDIVVDNKKLAGILIENSIQGNSIKYSISGIGININQVEFPVFPYRATSIYLETGKAYRIDQITRPLSERLLSRYGQLSNGEESLMDQEYLERLFMKDRVSSFESGNRSFEAIIRGVNRTGELVVEADGRIEEYGFHEITMNY